MVIVRICVVRLGRFLEDPNSNLREDVRSDEEESEQEEGKGYEDPLGNLP